jgi:hypothetical protein
MSCFKDVDEVVEVKTDSDVGMLVSPYIPRPVDGYQEVCFAFTKSPGDSYELVHMGMHPDMTLTHFESLTGCSFTALDWNNFSYVDSTTPILMHSQPLFIGSVTSDDVSLPGWDDPKVSMRQFFLKKEGHRHLRIVLDHQEHSSSNIELLSVDTGIGMSTVFNAVELVPNTLVISRGSGCARKLLPRHGPLKTHIDISSKGTIVLASRGTLHGEGKRKLDIDNSDGDAFDELDNDLEEDILLACV